MKFSITEYVEMIFIYFENNESQKVTARIFGVLHPVRPTSNNNITGENLHCIFY